LAGALNGEPCVSCGKEGTARDRNNLGRRGGRKRKRKHDGRKEGK